jgi:urocanate hydratase
MVICVAIISGGAAMLAYKNEIIDWIANEGYECIGCGKQRWTAISPEMEKEMATQERYQRKKEAESLLQTKIHIAERSLKTKGIEFENIQGNWIILEPSGDLKQIASISELESFLASQ